MDDPVKDTLKVVSSEQITAIKFWVDNSNEYESIVSSCPFADLFDTWYDNLDDHERPSVCEMDAGEPFKVCAFLFPQCVTRLRCPCIIYGYDFVWQRAKELLKLYYRTFTSHGGGLSCFIDGCSGRST